MRFVNRQSSIVNRNKCLTKGFTLLEILVSITIISVIMIVIVQVFLTTTRVNTKTEILKDIKQNGDFAMETIERMTRYATNISCSSGDGIPSQSLTITNADTGTSTFGCALDVGIPPQYTQIASQSAMGALTSTQYLTSTDISLAKDISGNAVCGTPQLSFVCTRQAGVSTEVKITFTLQSKSSSPDRRDQAPSTVFQSTVTLRNND
jgi:prepilin-type N-terminal cleavage/methylation domain-containing protein